jgi:hypothetical protein
MYSKINFWKILICLNRKGVVGERAKWSPSTFQLSANFKNKKSKKKHNLGLSYKMTPGSKVYQK